jgi:hypothetical protein
MRDVAAQLAALQTMSPAQLREEWQKRMRQPAPAVSPDLLRRGIAYRLQEATHGGLIKAAARELRDIRKRIAQGSSPLPGSALRLKPGTRLLRTWRGKTYSVLVADTGFIFNDRLFPSLSPIAQEITGTAWSGPRFFGLLAKRAATEACETHRG